MSKIKFKTLIFLLLFLTSCGTKSKKNTSTIKSFPINIELTNIAVNIPVNILSPSRICIIDDKFFVYDNVKNNLFKVFNLPNLDYLFSWGKIGRGPDEFIFVDDNYIRAFKNELELVDNGRLKRLLIKSDGLSTKSVIKLPRLQNPINHLQRINDSIYISDNIFTDGEFEHFLINVNTDKISRKFGKYPNDGLNIKNNIEKYQIYSKSNISSPDGKKFVVFYTYFGRIKIYDNNGNLQKNIILQDDEIQRFSVENRESNSIYFFSYPYATERYIYVLRLKMSENEVIKNIDCFKPELLILDWSGNPIAQCKLDRPITSFAISEKYKKIYGVYMMSENKIFVFDLPVL